MRFPRPEPCPHLCCPLKNTYGSSSALKRHWVTIPHTCNDPATRKKKGLEDADVCQSCLERTNAPVYVCGHGDRFYTYNPLSFAKHIFQCHDNVMAYLDPPGGSLPKEAVKNLYDVYYDPLFRTELERVYVVSDSKIKTLAPPIAFVPEVPNVQFDLKSSSSIQDYLRPEDETKPEETTPLCDNTPIDYTSLADLCAMREVSFSSEEFWKIGDNFWTIQDPIQDLVHTQ